MLNGFLFRVKIYVTKSYYIVHVKTTAELLERSFLGVSANFDVGLINSSKSFRRHLR